MLPTSGDGQGKQLFFTCRSPAALSLEEQQIWVHLRPQQDPLSKDMGRKPSTTQ